MSTYNKSRNWVFILYPESAPEDWRQKLAQSGIRSAVSPLHDKDLNPDGTQKKPHYHIMFCFDGPITQMRANIFTAMFNGTIAIHVDSVRGMYRYLTHKDNPEKYQYSDNEITLYNGFDPTSIVTAHETLIIKRQIQTFIIENRIYEYSTLMDMIACNDDLFDWYFVASNNTTFFNAYLKSRKFHLKEITESCKNS